MSFSTKEYFNSPYLCKKIIFILLLRKINSLFSCNKTNVTGLQNVKIDRSPETEKKKLLTKQKMLVKKEKKKKKRKERKCSKHKMET